MDRISQFLQNQQFVNWVFHPTRELDLKWQKFQEDHPKEKYNVLLAKKVLEKFRPVDRQLSEQEKIKLLARILSDIEKKQKSHEFTLRILSFAKYAAVAFIFFSVGALLFYQHEYANPEIAIRRLDNTSQETLTTLTRANGQSIRLADNKSVFSYQTSDNKLIVNDSLKFEKFSGSTGDQMNKLNVPYGKTSEVLLADGTKVFLNAGSQLMYPESFVEKKREVYLVGEAYFEVHKDQSHPFIVVTSDINIEVKGTKFNLSAYESDEYFETVLTEGKVRIRQNRSRIFDGAIDLEPNQIASFDRINKETKVKTVDVENYTLWKDGMFKFESSDFSWVMKKIERFYNVHFTISDPSILKLKISGKLELNDNQDAVIKILSTTASVKISKKAENLYEIKK
jgi:hypothetical protein